MIVVLRNFMVGQARDVRSHIGSFYDRVLTIDDCGIAFVNEGEATGILFIDHEAEDIYSQAARASENGYHVIVPYFDPALVPPGAFVVDLASVGSVADACAMVEQAVELA